RRGLTGAGFLTSLMETRHVNAALSTVKTDRRDARGIAQLLRMGWFRPVHAKSAGSEEVRALLVARKQLQHKFRDIELSLRGILRGFGLKVGKVTDNIRPSKHASASSLPAIRCLSRSPRPCWPREPHCSSNSTNCTRPCSRLSSTMKSAAGS